MLCTGNKEKNLGLRDESLEFVYGIANDPPEFHTLNRSPRSGKPPQRALRYLKCLCCLTHRQKNRFFLVMASRGNVFRLDLLAFFRNGGQLQCFDETKKCFAKIMRYRQFRMG